MGGVRGEVLEWGGWKESTGKQSLRSAGGAELSMDSTPSRGQNRVRLLFPLHLQSRTRFEVLHYCLDQSRPSHLQQGRLRSSGVVHIQYQEQSLSPRAEKKMVFSCPQLSSFGCRESYRAYQKSYCRLLVYRVLRYFGTLSHTVSVLVTHRSTTLLRQPPDRSRLGGPRRC